MTETPPDLAPDIATPDVRLCTSADEQAWEKFVGQSAAATFFHRFGWRKVIAEAFGHQPFYLAAVSADEIRGILPLFHIRSLLFGNSLISVPFCVYGGIVAQDEQAAAALADAAMDHARRLGVDYLELRHEQPVLAWPAKSDRYVTFRKAISADSDANLLAIPRKQRAMIRRAMKAELSSYQTTDTDALYSMYSESVRNLGTPVFAKRYFDLLQQQFGDDCETTIVVSDGKPVAGVMSFYFKDQVLPYYGGGTAAARRVSANDFLYWQVMCLAAERGTGVFDYGRSKVGTGSYRFKKHWGFDAEPLNYEYGLVKAAEIPDLSPANPRYSLFIRMWKKLPLAVAQRIGPMIARNLG
ncbi:MAG: FemAB family PEP-CTERM system-associated protein [Gammaproteobacteria bacterium]|nr:FemAB family PEP-CTERM system-associated protein [Gammaproteobacteria bacterium]NNF59891.1 FemAB family PEP-CTERM system-associated protein [Gammaproteobacteria bacterium]NNM21625.1 FemAB family PEP-CTERM system-associated protein [Gammaproteobacteria bacterium]